MTIKASSDSSFGFSNRKLKKARLQTIITIKIFLFLDFT